MSQSLYELIALGARYLFAALMVLIVARAWRITIVDSRRAQTLRRLSPETGLSGELVVMEGDEKARRGMRYPVTREGMIGASRRADIRIRHSSVRRRHAWFQLTPEGLSIRAHAGAPMRLAGRPAARELILKDGDIFDIGHVRLLLVLSEAAEDAPPDAPARRGGRGDDWPEDDDYDDGFDVGDPDRLFEENPVLRRMPERRYPPGSDFPQDPDDLFFGD